MIRRLHLIATSTGVGIKVCFLRMIRHTISNGLRIFRVLIRLLSSNGNGNALTVTRKSAFLLNEGGLCPTRISRTSSASFLSRRSTLRILLYPRRNKRLGIMFMMTITRNRTTQLRIILHRRIFCIFGKRPRRDGLVQIKRGLWLTFSRAHSVRRYRFHRLLSTALCSVFNGLTRVGGHTFIRLTMYAIIF